MNRSNIIAIDADGVLLDYATAYRQAWSIVFGELPDERDPHAYWPMDRWAVRSLVGDEKRRFRSQFDEAFWSNIPPLPGALVACHALVEAGYELVCVTAMKPGFEEARRTNLEVCGFPISDLIVTTMSEVEGGPKADVINRLRPAAFVDDYAPYLRGIQPGIHKALILRALNGSPNVGKVLAFADTSHLDLSDFVRWWIRCD